MPTVNPPAPKASSAKQIGIILLILAVIASAGAYYVLHVYEPTPPTPFKITSVSGKPEFFSAASNQWQPAERGQLFGTKDKIRTDENSEVNLEGTDKIHIRVKPQTELNNQRRRIMDEELKHRLRLIKGTVIGATEKNFESQGPLEISTPALVAAIRGTLFRIDADPKTDTSVVSVLRGVVDVTPVSGTSAEAITVENVHKVIVRGGQAEVAPVRITREDWMNMQEAYELIQRSAALEALQLDLSKKAGNFFAYVFDHGTFYSKNFGFADREFFHDALEDQVYMQTEYDVFPKGSYVGVYIKVRDLDASQYEGLSFETRYTPEEGFPDEIRMELKSKGAVARAIAPKGFKREWTEFTFPFNSTQELPITELTVVYNNSKVGESKRGILQFRKFNLIPLSAAEVERRKKLAEARAAKAAALKEEAEDTAAQSAAPLDPAKPAPPETSNEDVWANF